jgi:hypothetical protein
MATVAWRGHAAQLYVQAATEKSPSRQALLIDTTTCAVLASIAIPAA